MIEFAELVVLKSSCQLSSFCFRGDVNSGAMRSGAIELLEKPIDEQTLFAAIDSSLILSHTGDFDKRIFKWWLSRRSSKCS
jgi:hypothetical protein